MPSDPDRERKWQQDMRKQRAQMMAYYGCRTEAELDEQLAFSEWLDGLETGNSHPDEYFEVPGHGWFKTAEFIPPGEPTRPNIELLEAVKRAVADGVAKAVAKPPGAVTGDYLSPAEFAQKLGVDRKTVDRQLAAMTEGEHFMRLGRRVVINVAAAMAFLSGLRDRASAGEQSLLEQFAAKAKRR